MCLGCADFVRSEQEACAVAVGNVLDVRWGTKVYTCVVAETLRAEGTITAKVEWDVPDEANASIILYDASVSGKAAPWRRCTQSPCLMLRLGASGYNSLFRGPHAAQVTKPSAAATPCGIFNFFLKTGYAHTPCPTQNPTPWVAHSSPLTLRHHASMYLEEHV